MSRVQNSGPAVPINKVNGTDGVPKKPAPVPLQQRPPRHLAHPAHQSPVPFQTPPPPTIPQQVIHSDTAPVQVYFSFGRSFIFELYIFFFFFKITSSPFSLILV